VKFGTREIAIAGILGAISVLLAVTRLGFIPFVAGTAITIMHVPVIIGAIVGGPLVGTLIGLIFGLSSLILASAAPTGPGDVFFTDPWVSVAPRLFLGIVAWGVYRSARSAGRVWAIALALLLTAVVLLTAWTVAGLESEYAMLLAIVIGVVGVVGVGAVTYRAMGAHPDALALSLSATAATLTNTGLVLGALVIRGYIAGSVAVVLGLANGPLEMIAAAIISVAVIAAWQQIALRPGGSSV